MSKYQLRFMFEFGFHCIWGMNEEAKKKHGYAIQCENLPISKDLLNELNSLQEEFATSLDWDCPNNPSPWTEEHKSDFIKRATIAFHKLKAELGPEYDITNEVFVIE